MAAAIERLVRAEVANESVRRELDTQLAGPKSSARVLAALPIIGLLLGSGLGASPLSWLTSTPIGLGVLLAGLTVEAVGLWWVSRLMRSVELLL